MLLNLITPTAIASANKNVHYSVTGICVIKTLIKIRNASRAWQALLGEDVVYLLLFLYIIMEISHPFRFKQKGWNSHALSKHYRTQENSRLHF